MGKLLDFRNYSRNIRDATFKCCKDKVVPKADLSNEYNKHVICSENIENSTQF